MKLFLTIELESNQGQIGTLEFSGNAVSQWAAMKKMAWIRFEIHRGGDWKVTSMSTRGYTSDDDVRGHHVTFGKEYHGKMLFRSIDLDTERTIDVSSIQTFSIGG